MTMTSLHQALGCAALLFVAGSACNAQAPASAPPTRPFLVSPNQRTGDATLVDLTSGRVTNVDIDGDAHEVDVSPDRRLAAFTVPSAMMGSSRKVVVMDLATGRVVRNVDSGAKDPHGVAFINDSVALVTALAGTSVSYVDVRNGRVLRTVDGIPANPYIVKLTATGRAYASSPHSSKVTEIDLASARVTRTLDLPDDPAGIAVSADGKELYAAVWRQNTGGGVIVYDLEKGAVVARLPAHQPRRITVTPNGAHVIVSDSHALLIIDRATRQVRSVPTAQNGHGSGVACSPDSTKCYVALSQAAEIVEVDVASAKVLRRFPAAKGADGLAYVAP